MSVWKVRHVPLDGLRRKLEERGKNLHSFANEIGIPYMKVYRWANGVCQPTLVDCKRMASALDCTIDELLGDEE